MWYQAQLLVLPYSTSNTYNFLLSIFIRPSVCLPICLICLSVLPICLICLSVCLPAYLSDLSVCLPACLSVWSVCLPVCLPACLSVCLSVCLPACLPACLSVCLSVCLPAFLPFISANSHRAFRKLDESAKSSKLDRAELMCWFQWLVLLLVITPPAPARSRPGVELWNQVKSCLEQPLCDGRRVSLPPLQQAAAAAAAAHRAVPRHAGRGRGREEDAGRSLLLSGRCWSLLPLSSRVSERLWLTESAEVYTGMSAHPLGCYRNRQISSMASGERVPSCRQSHTGRRAPCVGLFRIIFIAFIHATRANKQGL